MRLTLYVVEDRSPRRRKPRHRLKERIGKTRNMSAQPIGKTSKERESYPTHCDGDVTVASGKLSLTSLADDETP